MSWQTADLLSADTTDVLAADTTDVLSADTSLQSSAMAPWSGGSFREDFARKNSKMRFSPRGSVWSVEGCILLRISLGLAVRHCWSDLKKFPKSASGEIWGRRFGSGTLGRKMIPENVVLWRNDFVVGF